MNNFVEIHHINILLVDLCIIIYRNILLLLPSGLLENAVGEHVSACLRAAQKPKTSGFLLCI